jgi:NlpC/P60 family putative phage cell wall peptidase
MQMISETRPHSGEEAVHLARAWIGTPYHHQACVKGVGADCLGLIRGIWRELYGSDAEMPPAYSRDWGEAAGEETLLAAAERHLIAIPIAETRAGDVLLFRLRAGAMAKHAGLLSSATTMIHAMDGRMTEEVVLGPWWRRRIAAAFSFPGTQR